MKTTVIKVSNIHCAGCVRNIKNALSQVEGVHEVDADIESGNVTINYEGDDSKLNVFNETLEEFGFPVCK